MNTNQQQSNVDNQGMTRVGKKSALLLFMMAAFVSNVHATPYRTELHRVH